MAGYRVTGFCTIIESSANDETYTWACCGSITAYTDAHGTASLTYDELGRNLTYSDSQGNLVSYTYDEMSRVTRITPPQGADYKTEYTFNKNGSLDTATTYDNGTGAATSYTYNTTSGKLTQRDFPESARQNIRTSYSYDSAGRLQYETVTREAAGTTSLYRTGYAYSYASYHRQVVRTEQNYDPAFGGTGWTTTASPTSMTGWSGWTTKSARIKIRTPTGRRCI